MNEKIELLNYFEGQWKYRNTHYWNLVIKDVYIGIIIILFPYLSSALGIKPSANLTHDILCVLGIIVSAIFTYLLLCENARIIETRKVIIRLVKDIGGGVYNPQKVHFIYRTPIAKVIPFAILIFHVLLTLLY